MCVDGEIIYKVLVGVTQSCNEVSNLCACQNICQCVFKYVIKLVLITFGEDRGSGS